MLTVKQHSWGEKHLRNQLRQRGRYCFQRVSGCVPLRLWTFVWQSNGVTARDENEGWGVRTQVITSSAPCNTWGMSRRDGNL